MIVGNTWKAKTWPQLCPLTSGVPGGMPAGGRARSPKTNFAPSVVKFSTTTKNELIHEKKMLGQPSGAKYSPITDPLRINTAKTIWSNNPAPIMRQLTWRRFSENSKAMPRMTTRPSTPRSKLVRKSMGSLRGVKQAAD